MFYNNSKKFVKKFPTLCKFFRWFKDSLIKLSRLKDVAIMMVLFHIWPEQTYRFSTRKLLPCKKNRFPKESRPIIPYDLLKSKGSNLPKKKEINAIGIGSSFDLNNLKNLNGPIFLLAFWSPLKINNNGRIIYTHNFSHESGNWIDTEEVFKDKTKKEFKKNNLTYVISRKKIVENFKKNGNRVLSFFIYSTDKDGNHYPLNKDLETSSSYLKMFDNNQCKHVAVVEKVYKPPLLFPHPSFAPTGSVLPFICSLSFFAEKINVYGWDYYLDSSPENMNYWQLFFKMYKNKNNDTRGGDHFENALINFYYGYQLSKLPNFKIHGYMGKLGKHHKLIKRIERVLFN